MYSRQIYAHLQNFRRSQICRMQGENMQCPSESTISRKAKNKMQQQSDHLFCSFCKNWHNLFVSVKLAILVNTGKTSPFLLFVFDILYYKTSNLNFKKTTHIWYKSCMPIAIKGNVSKVFYNFLSNFPKIVFILKPLISFTQSLTHRTRLRIHNHLWCSTKAYKNFDLSFC